MAYSAPVWAPGAGQVGGEGRTQWAPPLARLGIFFLDECDQMRRMRRWRPALGEGPAPAATAGTGGGKQPRRYSCAIGTAGAVVIGLARK